MPDREVLDIEKFKFRGLHPDVFFGTASDRYAGWIGQIYPADRYLDRISRRKKTVGGSSFVEEVLPVASVSDYFDHFRVLELDFTFYRLLLDKDEQPTTNYHVLKKYQQCLTEEDNLILKVPQVICAQKLWRGGKFIENDDYLDPSMFIQLFYEPAVEILGDALSGLIFEQEYQRKKDRTAPQDVASAFDSFFEEIPKDNRYHIELRTEAYLDSSVFEVLEKHGIGQVLSHWTWLPPLSKQFARSGNRFLNAGKHCIVRLMTPRGTRYEEAYARAHPFDSLVEEMLSQQMVEETAELMQMAINQGIRINIIINNRAGGNAPLVGQQIAWRFMEMGE